MNTFRKPFFIVLLLFPVFAYAQVSDNEKHTKDAIDRYLQTKFSEQGPGASVLVVKEGKTFFRKGYGLADLETKTPISPDMVFRIGSITKQFTATAILKLAEQGKIRIEDAITKYLPDYPVQGKTITIQHLLTHTSGIKSYTSLPAVITKDAKAKAVTVQQMIDVFKNEPMDFAPGEHYLYNNSGYFLLGAIIEKVSGTTWGNFLQKNFFDPLKMTSTFTDDGNISNAVSGYEENNRMADYVHPSMPYSAGAIFSTVDDLWKWNEAIFNYRVVKKASLAQAWTPLVLTSGEKESYGYGWQLGRIGNEKVIAHGGAIDGFIAFALYVPDLKIFVAVLCNSMPGAPEAIAYHLATLATGKIEKELTPLVLDEKTLDQYVGVYTISAKEDRIISREGNQLYSQRSNGRKFEIYPYEKDAFFFKNSPSRLRFFRDPDGSIDRVEMRGRSFVDQVASRTDKSLPKDRQVIKVDPLIFDAYVGQYELAPGFILTMHREGDQFFSQATGQQVFEIFPESETRFFLKLVDAQLEFKRDEQGNVTSVTLFQGGRVMPAKKISNEVPESRKSMELSPALYDRYTGEYELAPGFSITIRKVNDKLMAQATGQSALEIVPESETKFFYKIVDAQLEFMKDESGKVNSLTLYQGGQTVPGKKIK